MPVKAILYKRRRNCLKISFSNLNSELLAWGKLMEILQTDEIDLIVLNSANLPLVINSINPIS